MNPQKSNTRILTMLVGVVVVMGALAWAAVCTAARWAAGAVKASS